MPAAIRTRFSRGHRFTHYSWALEAMDKNKNFNESSLNLSEAGSLKLDLADNKLFCDMMMLRMQRGETVDGRLGLDILERCWGRLQKASAKGNVLGHILRKVSSPEDVERLKDWRTRMSGMGTKSISGRSAVVDQQWAQNLLDSVDAKLTSNHCRSMMHQTFKKVFK